MDEELRPLTFGEKAVGLTFNPGNNPQDEIKNLYAQIIDLCNNSLTPDTTEKNRLFKIAITEAQGAQMWAVKAVTWQN
jgi:hypothetical protein